MTPAAVDAYLAQLARELRKRGLADTRILDEARDHLVDAVEEGLRRGLSAEAAERQACTRFGPPELVATSFSKERSRMLIWLLTIASKIAEPWRSQRPRSGHYHDVSAPSVVHFALRVKRSYRVRFARVSADEQKQLIADMQARGEDVAAFETDPHERLVHFLGEFGRRRFGASETLESLTLLEDMTDPTRRGGRYLAAFGGGTKMIWTVTLRPDGSVSFDGTSSTASPLRDRSAGSG